MDVAKHIHYYNTTVIYDQNDSIDSKGAEISFLNYGDGPDPATGIFTGATVNLLGYMLKPGFGVSYDGNENELDVTKYKFYFVGAGTQNLVVVQKNFV
jgi:hypothetical protein